tara:strand:- start:2646 stop:3068 length:423 start_codon:yes stop_codon:yes gene_type:complete
MTPTKTSSHPVDRHVGTKLKARRNLLGLSQDDLAKEVDLTYQQIQKYESGANRIGASRLFEFSKILSVAVDYFFEGLDTGINVGAPGFGEKKQAPFQALEDDVMNKKETFELVRAYYQIRDPKLRHQILEMAKTMGRSGA